MQCVLGDWLGRGHGVTVSYVQMVRLCYPHCLKTKQGDHENGSLLDRIHLKVVSDSFWHSTPAARKRDIVRLADLSGKGAGAFIALEDSLRRRF